jgi:hypothetical protein
VACFKILISLQLLPGGTEESHKNYEPCRSVYSVNNGN